MPRTPDDSATTWRDLAAELTPEQRAELEYCEANNFPPGYTDERGLNEARALIAHNLTQALCAEVATPPDALDQPAPWEHWGDGYYTRLYTAGPAREAAGYRLDMLGIQHDSGRIERHVMIGELDEDRGGLTAAEARELGAALIEAADELDRLDG